MGNVSVMSTREMVLDAFEELLISAGERAATLEAVAALAEVSKGGLLYHFQSKDALIQGLLDRLAHLAAADADAMRSDPRGPSAYYVDSSVYTGSTFDRALVATASLVPESDEARTAMQSIQRTWFSIVLDEVGDRALARAIVLIGDGLYYNAVLSGGAGSKEVAGARDADRAELLEVVARLIAGHR